MELQDTPKHAETTEDEFGFTPSEQRRIIHKIDRRLITGLGLLFGVSLMDRTNLGNASIAGMQQELKLNIGARYSIVLLVFFIPYVIVQFPSSIIVRKIGARAFLAGITFAWGVVMIGFGFVHDWKTMLGLRVILGAFEAGLFPGAIYLLSLWYTRYEVHKRYSSFYLISVIGGSLSGVLAYGFMQMAGLAGLAAWKWIFIMEGILTCIFAVIGFFLLVSFPQDVHKSRSFLPAREIEFVLWRIEQDRQDVAEEPFTLSAFIKPAAEWMVWGFAIIFLCSTVVSYAIAFFLPIILSSKLGFGVGASQALSTPPYFFAGVVMYVEGWLGDKWHLRSPIIIYNSLQTIVGLCLLEWVASPGVQYFGLFLVASGSNANIPAVLAWQANNIRGQWKRAFCSASMITCGGIGGIIGAVVYRSQDAPTFFPGVITSIGLNILIMALTGILTLYFHRANGKARLGRTVIEGLPGFHYTL
ncbi:phthalate transporter [Penicillium nucicola]|uniref:phthalate transporter n=1 Tax=Penicillium nucicola TaxID=1850975 RepID=UPI002544FE4A|nr:phthalate transporter [Penicillium nucicola]KAJ5775100.1 phthalate transporter [Penicillium nucicola]